jgi:hypothetical protein
MPKPLESLNITGSDYGADTLLTWAYPDTLPDQWQLFIFYKANSAVTDDQINAYFSLDPDVHLNDKQLSDLGIHVFHNIPNTATEQSDFGVLPGVAAFYSAVIRDTKAGANSTTVTESYTPTPYLAINTMDTKSIVTRAVEKMLGLITNVAGDKLKIGTDVKVFKDYASPKELDTFVVVQRTSGQGILRQLHDDAVLLGEDVAVKAEIDSDVLMIEWIAVGNSKRRDVLTDIFRAGRQIIRYYILAIGNGDIKDVRFIPGGDGSSPYGKEGGVAHGNRLMVQLELETQVQVGVAQSSYTFTGEIEFVGDQK